MSEENKGTQPEEESKVEVKPEKKRTATPKKPNNKKSRRAAKKAATAKKATGQPKAGEKPEKAAPAAEKKEEAKAAVAAEKTESGDKTDDSAKAAEAVVVAAETAKAAETEKVDGDDKADEKKTKKTEDGDKADADEKAEKPDEAATAEQPAPADEKAESETEKAEPETEKAESGDKAEAAAEPAQAEKAENGDKADEPAEAEKIEKTEKTEKHGGIVAFFAKKTVRIVLAVLCVLLVAGGIGWWAYTTTPGWHHGEKTSYYIMEGTHSRAKGFYTIDDTEYAFDDHGVLMHGFGRFDGKEYYADENGQRLYGDIEIDGVSYHLDEDTGEYRTGLYSTEEGTIGFSETGFPLHSTVGYVKNAAYYFDRKGLMQATNGLYKALGNRGATYYPLDTGVLQTGWQTIGDKRYYFDPESCAMQIGVTAVEGKNYLLGNDGTLCTGITEVRGDTYMADADGVVMTGWQTQATATAETAAQSVATAETAMAGTTYYLDPETGKMTFGHREIDGAVYFFDTRSGAMVCSGLGNDDDGTYWLGADGKAMTGWQQKDKRRYYFGEDCKAVTGYQTLDGNKYHFNESGALQTGIHTVDDVLCYFGEDGIIKACAYEYDGASRLFDEDGKVLSGWHELAGVNYYYDQGVKQTGEVTIGDESFYLGSDGIMRTGWVGDYYYSDRGYPYRGAQKVDGVLHYFDSTGRMLRNTNVGTYQIDANGVAKKVAVPAGGSVGSCYNYVRGYMHYASVPAASYDEMVQYALANHRGSCYHYAALLHYVLAQSGIGSNIVWGINPQGGTHVWCTLGNGNIVDACNGYFNITPEQMAAKGFSW